MKKSLILLLVLSLLLCSCGKTEAAPETAPPAETAAPTEYVQEVTGPEAEVDPEDITEPVATETVVRLVRTSVLNDKGEEVLYREYFYDAYGRETEYWEYSDGEVLSFCITNWISDTEAEITYSYYEDGILIHMVYDEAGRPILNEKIEHGTVTSKTTHTYDEQGNTVNTVSVVGDYANTYVYEYTYDDRGNILVRQEFMNGDSIGRLEVEYDAEGREIASVYYYPDGTVNYTTRTTYEGDAETRTSFDSDGTAYLTQITVTDQLGNILSRETWQEDMMVSRTENTYEEIQIIAQ